MRRALMIMVLALAALLGLAGGAQALVLSGGASGHVGVATLPGTPIPTVSGSCQDPWLFTDLGGPILPDGSLCFHAGGSVLHGTETFAITWDPIRYDWATTRDYLEGFLKNVANGSHTLTSPYAVTHAVQGRRHRQRPGREQPSLRRWLHRLRPGGRVDLSVPQCGAAGARTELSEPPELHGRPAPRYDPVDPERGSRDGRGLESRTA